MVPSNPVASGGISKGGACVTSNAAVSLLMPALSSFSIQHEQFSKTSNNGTPLSPFHGETTRGSELDTTPRSPAERAMTPDCCKNQSISTAEVCARLEVSNDSPTSCDATPQANGKLFPSTSTSEHPQDNEGVPNHVHEERATAHRSCEVKNHTDTVNGVIRHILVGAATTIFYTRASGYGETGATLSKPSLCSNLSTPDWHSICETVLTMLDTQWPGWHHYDIEYLHSFLEGKGVPNHDNSDVAVQVSDLDERGLHGVNPVRHKILPPPLLPTYIAQELLRVHIIKLRHLLNEDTYNNRFIDREIINISDAKVSGGNKSQLSDAPLDEPRLNPSNQILEPSRPLRPSTALQDCSSGNGEASKNSRVTNPAVEHYSIPHAPTNSAASGVYSDASNYSREPADSERWEEPHLTGKRNGNATNGSFYDIAAYVCPKSNSDGSVVTPDFLDQSDKSVADGAKENQSQWTNDMRNEYNGTCGDINRTCSNEGRTHLDTKSERLIKHDRDFSPKIMCVTTSAGGDTPCSNESAFKYDPLPGEMDSVMLTRSDILDAAENSAQNEFERKQQSNGEDAYQLDSYADSSFDPGKDDIAVWYSPDQEYGVEVGEPDELGSKLLPTFATAPQRPFDSTPTTTTTTSTDSPNQSEEESTTERRKQLRTFWTEGFWPRGNKITRNRLFNIPRDVPPNEPSDSDSSQINELKCLPLLSTVEASDSAEPSRFESNPSFQRTSPECGSFGTERSQTPESGSEMQLVRGAGRVSNQESSNDKDDSQTNHYTIGKKDSSNQILNVSTSALFGQVNPQIYDQEECTQLVDFQNPERRRCIDSGSITAVPHMNVVSGLQTSVDVPNSCGKVNNFDQQNQCSQRFSSLQQETLLDFHVLRGDSRGGCKRPYSTLSGGTPELIFGKGSRGRSIEVMPPTSSGTQNLQSNGECLFHQVPQKQYHAGQLAMMEYNGFGGQKDGLPQPYPLISQTTMGCPISPGLSANQAIPGSLASILAASYQNDPRPLGNRPGSRARTYRNAGSGKSPLSKDADETKETDEAFLDEGDLDDNSGRNITLYTVRTGGRVYRYWQVFFYEDSRRKESRRTKNFPIDKLGNAEAKRQALEYLKTLKVKSLSVSIMPNLPRSGRGTQPRVMRPGKRIPYDDNLSNEHTIGPQGEVDADSGPDGSTETSGEDWANLAVKPAETFNEPGEDGSSDIKNNFTSCRDSINYIDNHVAIQRTVLDTHHHDLSAALENIKSDIETVF